MARLKPGYSSGFQAVKEVAEAETAPFIQIRKKFKRCGKRRGIMPLYRKRRTQERSKVIFIEEDTNVNAVPAEHFFLP